VKESARFSTTIARDTLRECVVEIERIEALGWSTRGITDYWRHKVYNAAAGYSMMVELRVEFVKEIEL